MKKIIYPAILLVILLTNFTTAEKPPASQATGLFLSFGVGPRIPIGEFATTTELGYGFNVEFSYTDNEFLPVFLYGSIGFEQYPGSQSYFQSTNYTNFHTNSLPVNLGVRYYFSPLLENIVLLMPIVQLSGSYNYYQKLHEFDEGVGRNNFLEDVSKFGFSAGVGVSMFMMEMVASYNYVKSNQFISVDLKVRIPIFINM